MDGADATLLNFFDSTECLNPTRDSVHADRLLRSASTTCDMFPANIEAGLKRLQNAR